MGKKMQCPRCNGWVYSMYGHDWRECECKGVFLDGGDDFPRIGCDPEISIASLEVLNCDKEGE